MSNKWERRNEIVRERGKSRGRRNVSVIVRGREEGGKRGSRGGAHLRANRFPFLDHFDTFPFPTPYLSSIHSPSSVSLSLSPSLRHSLVPSPKRNPTTSSPLSSSLSSPSSIRWFKVSPLAITESSFLDWHFQQHDRVVDPFLIPATESLSYSSFYLLQSSSFLCHGSLVWWVNRSSHEWRRRSGLFGSFSWWKHPQRWTCPGTTVTIRISMSSFRFMPCFHHRSNRTSSRNEESSYKLDAWGKCFHPLYLSGLSPVVLWHIFLLFVLREENESWFLLVLSHLNCHSI